MIGLVLGSEPSDDCGSSSDPEEQLTEAQSYAEKWLAWAQTECAEGNDQICEDIKKYMACFDVVVKAVQSDGIYTTWETGTQLASSASDIVSTSVRAGVATIGAVASTGIQVISAGRTLLRVAHAYQSCFPTWVP